MKSAKTPKSEKQFLRLVKRARRGDDSAFDVLIQEKGQDILYSCIRLMKNKQDGEDVAQDVVIRLKKEIVKLEKPEAFGGWMYRVIYTTCMNAKKRNSRLPDLDEQAIINAPLEEEREEFLPQKYAETEESRKRLLEAIDLLPDKQRACILFFYYSDMSYIEIAEALDTNEQDVANCLNRAKKKLKSLLEGDEGSRGSGVAAVAAKGAGVVGAASVIGLAMEQQAMALVAPQMVGTLQVVATSVAIGGGAAAGAQAAGASSVVGGLGAVPTQLVAGVASVAVVGAGGAAVYNVATEEPLPEPPALVETVDPEPEAPVENVPVPEAEPEPEPTQTVVTYYEVTFVEQEDVGNLTEEEKVAKDLRGTALTKENFPQEGLLEEMKQYDINGDGYLDGEEIAKFPGYIGVETEQPVKAEE